MKFQKTISLPKEAFSYNDLSKKETIRKNNKEIKAERSILSFSINHDSIA